MSRFIKADHSGSVFDDLHLETNNSTTLWKLTYDNQLLRHAVVLRYQTPLGLHNRFAPLCYLL